MYDYKIPICMEMVPSSREFFLIRVKNGSTNTGYEGLPPIFDLIHPIPVQMILAILHNTTKTV